MYARGYHQTLTALRSLAPASIQQFKPRITPRVSACDSQTLTLPDGRTLGFAEYGSPTGFPLLCFHGLPGSRIDWPDWDKLGKKLDIRILGLDRPGFGLSTFQPNRTVLDWPADVKYFTNHLSLRNHRIIGGSGGGPYILACAKALPRSELLGVGMIACVGPWEAGNKGMSLVGRAVWTALALWPSAIGKLMAMPYERAARAPDSAAMVKLVEKALKQMRAKDAAVFEDETLRIHFAETLREAFRQGPAAFIHEAQLITRPWGFELEEITEHKVQMWYGTEDVNTPVRMGKWMAERLPNAEMKEYPGDTHFTVAANHEEDILKDFIASG